jgi:hypothetical protein
MFVEWTHSALDHLADLFVAADPEGRTAIERAVLEANAKLADDPWELGESRRNRYDRAWSVPRLSLLFQIDPTSETVTVYHVARSR